MQKNPNFIPLRQKKEESTQETEKKETEKTPEDFAREEEEEKKRKSKIGITFKAKNSDELIPVAIDLDANKKTAYNDYLIAIAEHKVLKFD